MTDAFAQIVGPIFQHVVEFTESLRKGEHPAPEAVKRTLVRLLDDAEKRASTSELLTRDFALARFGIVYWIDEVLIHSPWRHAGGWKNIILELDYFGTRQAAQDFWVRVKQAEGRAAGQGRPPRSSDPLEAYFLCVALGFRGELFLDEDEIRRWAERVYPLVLAGQAVVEEANGGATPPGYWGVGALPGERLLVAVSVLLSATALLTLFGFIAAVHNRGS